MNSQNFNDTLKERAAKFILTPYDNALGNVIEARRKKRQRQTRWLLALIGLSSCILITTIVFFNQPDKLEISNHLINENKVREHSVNSLRYQAKTENGNESLRDKMGEISNGELNSKSRISNETRQSSVNSLVEIQRQVKLAKNAKEKVKMNFNSIQKPTISIVENHNPIASNTNNDKSLAVANSSNVTNNEIEVAKMKSATSDTVPSINSQVAQVTSVLKNDSLTKLVGDSKRVPKTKYGFQGSIFNHYMLLNQAYNGAENDLIKNDFGINYKEQAIQSYSVGVMAGLSINKFSFSIGLAYNQVGFDKLLFIESQLQNTTAPGIKDIFLNSSGYKVNVIDQSLSFVEVPILVGYKMGSKKLTCNIEAGLTTQYLNQTNTYLLVMNNNRLETSTNDDAASNRFEKWQLGFVSSINMQYSLTKNIGIFVGPIAKVHTYQYYKKEFTERNAPLYFGVNSGIKFIF